ncbi:haloacid dehalogenase type II [Pseudarthrobacter sp. L19]|uniref:haloacid dehalogenase type II n=1 Tax=Pseudarthrobacter sp. L19 TaxID=3423951 RepID=UPI003D7BE32C
MPREPYKALLFDVQGTLTDFRTTLLDHGRTVLGDRAAALEWPSMVDEWRTAYRTAVAELSGARQWRSVRSIYTDGLADIVRRRGLEHVVTANDIALLTAGWEQLRPWPDAAAGLRKLRQSHLVAALSNADLSAVISTSRTCGFVWDAVFSAQQFRAFKPHESTYLGAAALLGVDPAGILMVASHRYDLDAAAELGLGTAFVYRPDEYGPGGNPDQASAGDYDVVVESIEELAEALNAGAVASPPSTRP